MINNHIPIYPELLLQIQAGILEERQIHHNHLDHLFEFFREKEHQNQEFVKPKFVLPSKHPLLLPLIAILLQDFAYLIVL